ncbi:deoxynucleotidyltransferase terminal-interacting protein 2-like [Oscarella lobularis]|uniref:deoxynucleotidyltransferase terminal-interacting protein 2-like n=1 Tax=Oscarella lobularis TaxID=121494 RepID=UPI003313891C
MGRPKRRVPAAQDESQSVDLQALASMTCQQMLSKKTSEEQRTQDDLPEFLRLEPSKPTTTDDLASKLDPGFDVNQKIYLNLEGGSRVVKNAQSELLKRSVVTADLEKRHCVPCEKSRHQAKRERRIQRDSSLGSKWFDLPAGEATEDAKRDLKILKMRGALDPKRFYKKEDMNQLPKFFQLGRVIEGPGEFYSGRLTRRQQKQSIVEELLADEKVKSYSKRKYQEIQAAKSKTLKRMRKKQKKHYKK